MYGAAPKNHTAIWSAQVAGEIIIRARGVPLRIFKFRVVRQFRGGRVCWGI